MPARPDHEAWWETIPRWFAGHYRRIAADPRFSHVLTAAVILYAVAVVIGSSSWSPLPANRLAAERGLAGQGRVGPGRGGPRRPRRGGLARITGEAYRWFIRGVLVWLLLTQVFAFYSSQLLGLGGLAVNLAAYITLRYALGHEIERQSA